MSSWAMRLNHHHLPLIITHHCSSYPLIDASAKHKTWSTVDGITWWKWIMKSLEWWVILLKCFDMCSWTLDDLDDKTVEAWALALLQNWWLSGCDTIPTLPYNHDTRIWVGLDWNFIYLSISSLTAKVWAEDTLWRLSTCAVPKMTVGHG